MESLEDYVARYNAQDLDGLLAHLHDDLQVVIYKGPIREHLMTIDKKVNTIESYKGDFEKKLHQDIVSQRVVVENDQEVQVEVKFSSFPGLVVYVMRKPDLLMTKHLIYLD